MFKDNRRNTRTRCEICSKSTIKTPERRQWRRSGVFIVNFEHISHLVLVFLLLPLSRQIPAGKYEKRTSSSFWVNLEFSVNFICLLYPFQRIVVFYIETSYLICITNQMTGFYMKCNTGLKFIEFLELKQTRKTIIQLYNGNTSSDG